MKATIKNNSRALQGVHTEAGLVHIEAGETRTVDVLPSYVDRVKALPFFTSTWNEGETVEQPAAAEPDPLDHDANGKKGGAIDLEALTVPELKDHAEKHGIDLGDATKKADIIAAIQLSAEQK